MGLLIFLVFSRYGLAGKYGILMEYSKYQYIIRCTTAFFDIWCNNCQSGKAITES